MGCRMAVQVEAENRSPGRAAAEHPLGAIAEGKHHNAIRPHGSRRRQAVHFAVVERLLHDVTPQPRIHDSRTVDAEQDPVTRFAGGVVDVYEGIDARLRVGLRRVGHAVDHAARAARRGHFARLQHVERESVVGLVARTVRNRSPGRDA